MSNKEKKPIRLGLYGCGARTRMVVSILWDDEPIEVAAMYDISEKAMQEMHNDYGGKICNSSQELLECEEVDAFIISLAPQAHFDAFMETVKVGKPIYQEKPIAMCAENALKMAKAADEHDVQVHVGFIHRYSPPMRMLQSFMRENPIGDIYGCRFQWFGRMEPNIINLINRGMQNNFRNQVSQVGYHCCHQLDLMRLYCGEVKKVFAKSLKWSEFERKSPDEVTAVLEFESGAIGTWQLSEHTKPTKGGEIHGQNYSVILDDFVNFEIWWRPPTKTLRDPGPGHDARDLWNQQQGPDTFTAPRGFNRNGANEWDVYVMRDFLKTVRGQQPSQSTLMDGFRAAEIAEAIERSAEEKREIELPLYE